MPRLLTIDRLRWPLAMALVSSLASFPSGEAGERWEQANTIEQATPAATPGAVTTRAQPPGATLPKDVDPETRCRLPRPRPEELDELGQKLLASIRETGDSAPRTIRLYSPKVGEYMTRGNQYLRYESGMNPQIREIAILLAARAMDQQYEWTAHEKAGREAGLPQSVIDIVKTGAPIAGIADEKQATLIQLGREVLYDHRVGPDTYARALKLFGKKGLVNVVSLIGHYSATAILLTVFDQHLPADQEPLLTPPRQSSPR